MLLPSRGGRVLLCISPYGSELLELVSAGPRTECSSRCPRGLCITRRSAEATLRSCDFVYLLPRSICTGPRLRPTSYHVSSRVSPASCVHLAVANSIFALVSPRARIHVGMGVHRASEPGTEANLRLALINVRIARIIGARARTLLGRRSGHAPPTCAPKAKLRRCRMFTFVRVR